jgi:hypothetical protein
MEWLEARRQADTFEAAVKELALAATAEFPDGTFGSWWAAKLA